MPCNNNNNNNYLKRSTRQELLSDWSIYQIVWHMIGQSKKNKRLHDEQDISVLTKKNNKQI